MIKIFSRLQPREVVLLTLTCIALISLPVLNRVLLPSYDSWNRKRDVLQMQENEYIKLRANLLISQIVNEQYEAVAKNQQQTESDEITVSNYLKEIESLARRSNMTLVNMKPLRVEAEQTHKVRPITLAVAGKLPVVLEFVSSVLNGDDITRLQSFALRGSQGDNMVECSMTIHMITLLAEH